MPRFEKALELSALAPGSMVGVEVQGKQILLSNLGGEIYAVDGVCTHEESLLSQGFMIEDSGGLPAPPLPVRPEDRRGLQPSRDRAAEGLQC